MRFFWPILGVLVFLGGLMWARYAESDSWKSGLYLSGGGAGFALASLVAILLHKFGSERTWKSLASAFLGLLVVGCSLVVSVWGNPPSHGPEPIIIWKIGVVSFRTVGGGVAVLLGSYALWEIVNASSSSDGRGLSFLLGCVGITCGLYGLAPVSRTVGLGVNHWTFLAMMVFSVVVFSLMALTDRILKASDPLRKKSGKESGKEKHKPTKPKPTKGRKPKRKRKRRARA